MAIQKLADDAVRVLGATQVLVDSAALVKELIDNALDAHATSVAIEISTNTVDVIQVRDNGHGIAPEDRAMVATANCTSKLYDFSDLKDVGGTTLGFRGQALAAAAEMSGTLTISTRVEGETVATAMRVNQLGEVVSQERASLPVGTTVRITDFIKANPVRRQRALKDAEKTLKHIKQTLQAYAFARPQVRLALRVLKAKSDKGNFMYAPKPGATIEDVSLKLVGSACVSQCTWTVVEDQGFVLQAFVPRPDGEPSKVGGIGAFLSVDGRPVSATRGTLKQIVKIFRDALKTAAAKFEGIKEPFMYMRVACPSWSYDPNVEPAKDDVLFEDADVVVALTRRLFAAVYPLKQMEETAVAVTAKHSAAQEPTATAPSVSEDDFVTSLEVGHIPSPGRSVDAWLASNAAEGMRTPVPTSPLRPDHVFRSNMYGCDEEDVGHMGVRPSTGRTEVELEEMRQARKDVTLSNPWVAAKMNASLRPSMTAEPDGDDRLAHDVTESRHGSIAKPQMLFKPAENRAQENALPTPRPSSPSPPGQDFHPSDHVPDIRLARDGRLIGCQALPPPRGSIERPPVPYLAFDHDSPQSTPVRNQPAYDYMVGTHNVTPNTGTPLHAIQSAGRRTRSPQKQVPQGNPNRPFVPPVMEQPPREKVWFDHLESSGQTRQKQRRQYQPARDDGLVRQGELGELLDEPRPLTPPRQNRDIRDFVGSVDVTGDDSASSMIERRNYGQTRRSRSESRPRSTSADENLNPSKGVLSARGFIPASELAAMEARIDSPHKTPARPPKRRKTGDSRPLRQLSINAPVSVQQDEHEQDNTGRDDSPPTSRRRGITEGSAGKGLRRKSSRLPLERIPRGKGMHNVDLKLSISMSEVSRCAGKVDEEASLLGWNQPALDTYDAFAPPLDAREIPVLTETLRSLLINRLSDGEMVQDLSVLVQNALSAHRHGVERDKDDRGEDEQ